MLSSCHLYFHWLALWKAAGLGLCARMQPFHCSYIGALWMRFDSLCLVSIATPACHLGVGSLLSELFGLAVIAQRQFIRGES